MSLVPHALVVIVAHRYGFVPPVELGGDGVKSITRLEVEAALAAGKPVFAFLIDEKAPWAHAREQDRLLSEPHNAAQIVAAVQPAAAAVPRRSRVPPPGRAAPGSGAGPPR